MNAIQIGLTIVSIVGLCWFSWKKPRLSSILVWSLIATLSSTAAALLIIPGPFSSKALWIALSVPIIWSAFQYWCYWADSQWQVLWSLLAISCVSALIVMNVDPVV